MAAATCIHLLLYYFNSCSRTAAGLGLLALLAALAVGHCGKERVNEGSRCLASPEAAAVAAAVAGLKIEDWNAAGTPLERTYVYTLLIQCNVISTPSSQSE